MTVTPEQADRLNKARTPGKWVADTLDEDFPNVMAVREEDGLITGKPITDGIWEEGDAALIAAAPDMAETIAGMTWEWRIEEWSGDYWYPCGEWDADESTFDGYTARRGERLVGRPIGSVKVVKGG